MNKISFRALDQWNQGRGPFFQIRECDLKWNFSSQNWISYEDVELNGVPAVVAMVAGEGARQGVPAQTLWISLWGTIQEGSESRFLEEALRFARSKEKTRLVLGADEFHFVPGIPLGDDQGDRLRKAAQSLGFSGEEEADLAGSVKSSAVREYIDQGRALLQEQGMRGEVFQEEKDLLHLSEFLSREFPGRWSREFEFWRGNRASARRGRWLGLRKGATLLGFARFCLRGEFIEQGWTPAALRFPAVEGAKWLSTDACLGPIGVAKEARGQGAGKILLSLVLEQLIQNGAELTCIDWTDAIKYYRPLGFSQIRRYWTCRKANI